MAHDTGLTGTGISARAADGNLTQMRADGSASRPVDGAIPATTGEGESDGPVNGEPANGIGAYGHTDIWIGGPVGENVNALDPGQTTVVDITGIEISDRDELAICCLGNDHVFGLTGDITGCADYDMFSGVHGMHNPTGMAGIDGSIPNAFVDVGEVIIDLQAASAADVLNLHMPGGSNGTADTKTRVAGRRSR